MLDKEEWVLIRVISNKFKEGVSISELSRQTGHDRKAICKYQEISKGPEISKGSKSQRVKSFLNCN